MQDAATQPQLRVLNPHVGSLLRGHALSALPTQVCSIRGDLSSTTSTIGGVSSFGYSGTIAHSVLDHPTGSEPEAARLPLTFQHQAFPWRDRVHPFCNNGLLPMMVRTSSGLRSKAMYGRLYLIMWCLHA